MNTSVNPNPRESASNLKGGLNWQHWTVVVLSLILTISAWHITSQQIEQKSKAQFDFESSQILELVQERMAKYEEALWSGVAALNMRESEASRADWKTFADILDIEDRFPGINGIGVIHFVPPTKFPAYLEWQRQALPDYSIHPSHDKNEYWPITYIEPQSSNNKAVGLDMAHEVNRYSAAIKARDANQANITGPITLVQDKQKTPGFLFYAPWYSVRKTNSDHFGNSQNGFMGLVYAPFIMYKLMDGTLTNTNRRVNFSIHDGVDELYNELNAESEDFDPNPMYSREITLQLYGRDWQFTVQSSLLFRQQHTQNQPMLILVGGLLIDALLLTIFLLLGRANRRAVAYAEQVTEDLQLRQDDLERAKNDLQTRNAALEEANHELDQFAFVASHDLKAPLRGISQLAQWIEEELEDKLTSQTSEFMSLMKTRISRLERLLDDLLAYSRIGRKESEFETFRVEDRIHEVFTLLSPPENFKLVCEDNIGEINTLGAPFDLVIRNLIGNAIKHHDKPTATIRVRANNANGRHVFSVEDDGPGISPEHQERVFELFHTLKPRDEVEGSGLGLSIIKKLLDRYKCQYELHSDGKQGTCINFNWPTTEQF